MGCMREYINPCRANRYKSHSRALCNSIYLSLSMFAQSTLRSGLIRSQVAACVTVTETEFLPCGASPISNLTDAILIARWAGHPLAGDRCISNQCSLHCTSWRTSDAPQRTAMCSKIDLAIPAGFEPATPCLEGTAYLKKINSYSDCSRAVHVLTIQSVGRAVRIEIVSYSYQFRFPQRYP